MAGAEAAARDAELVERVTHGLDDAARLIAKERKELKEDLLSKLMPRVLPTIRLIDALYLPKDGMILLFGTSSSVREAFLSLFYKTFSATLAPADPYRLAVSLNLGKEQADQLSRVTQVSWPRSSSAPSTTEDEPTPTEDLEVSA